VLAMLCPRPHRGGRLAVAGWHDHEPSRL